MFCSNITVAWFKIVKPYKVSSNLHILILGVRLDVINNPINKNSDILWELLLSHIQSRHTLVHILELAFDIVL